MSNSLSVSASDSSDSCHTRYWTWRCTATRASASSALDSFSLVGKRFFDALVRNDCAIGEKRGTVGSDRWPMCVDSAHRKKRRYDGGPIVRSSRRTWARRTSRPKMPRVERLLSLLQACARGSLWGESTYVFDTRETPRSNALNVAIASMYICNKFAMTKCVID